MFNESIKNSSTLSYGSWYTDRKVVNDGLEFQVDIDSAQNINSPRYLIAVPQFLDRIGVPNKSRNIAIFGKIDVSKYFGEVDGQRYPKDAIVANYAANDYLDQYRDL